MVTENCKKIEPVVVQLCSKTNIPLFSEHGVVNNMYDKAHGFQSAINNLTITHLVYSTTSK